MIIINGTFRKARVLGKAQELLSVNAGRFEINKLFFADYTALVTDAEAKLCRRVSEFGRVCEIRKLRENVGKSKVMRAPRYGNMGRMHEVLNGEPLQDVDCLSAWGRKWQLMEDVKMIWYTE